MRRVAVVSGCGQWNCSRTTAGKNVETVDTVHKLRNHQIII